MLRNNGRGSAMDLRYTVKMSRLGITVACTNMLILGAVLLVNFVILPNFGDSHPKSVEAMSVWAMLIYRILTFPLGWIVFACIAPSATVSLLFVSICAFCINAYCWGRLVTGVSNAVVTRASSALEIGDKDKKQINNE